MGDIKTIIVSRTDKIGDFIVSIPSFATLKAMYPDCRLVALVSSATKILAESLHCIDITICADEYSPQDLRQKVCELQPDVFIALLATPEIIRLAFLSGAPVRIGPRSRLLSFPVFNHGIRQHRSKCVKSEAHYNLDLIEHLNPELFKKTGIRCERISYTREDASAVDAFLKDHGIEEGARFILINPVSGGSGCNMKLSDYAAVINRICEKAPTFTLEQSPDHDDRQDMTLSRPLPDMVLMGIPQQKEKLESVLSMVRDEFKRQVRIFINERSLLTAAAMVDRCKVFMGPSTGITHIAGNYKKPVLCFYSTRPSNSHTRWALFDNGCNEVPFTMDESRLDEKTREIRELTEGTLQALTSTALEELHND